MRCNRRVGPSFAPRNEDGVIQNLNLNYDDARKT